MKKILILLVAIFMLTASFASAATFKVGDIYEYEGNIPADDIYAAGGVIDISGDIKGDGLLVGGDISVLGNVTQDVLVIGGAVRVLGSVGDDLRAVGGNVTVSDRVGDDLVVAGGFVRVLSDSLIVSDAFIAGGAVVMNGTIAGNLTTYAEEVTINGVVGGDVNLNFAKKVIIGNEASIAGDLTYSSSEEIEIPEGALVVGKISRVESPLSKFDVDKKGVKKIVGFLLFAKFIVVLVTGVLAVLVFRRFSNTLVVQTHDKFWKHALLGFVALIVVPIASVILFMTFFGVAIGFLLLSVYALMLCVAKIYAGVVAGAFLSKWIKKKVIVDWKWAALGILALYVVSLIPVVGWIACFIFVLASFGTLGMLVYKKIWLNR